MNVVIDGIDKFALFSLPNWMGRAGVRFQM